METVMSKLVVNCDQKDKAVWVQAAIKGGMKLEAWVNKALNEAAAGVETAVPGWMASEKFNRVTERFLIDHRFLKESDLYESCERGDVIRTDATKRELETINRDIHDWVCSIHVEPADWLVVIGLED